MEETEESLNPLHCGAVVASVAATTAVWRAWQVSIPFIAGQWSLHSHHGCRGFLRSCFNPLHCGAVVASGEQ